MWIGFDIDGTLAYQENNYNENIGAPIPLMINRLKQYVERGDEVRIFTARTDIENIKNWLIENLGMELPIQNFKDRDLLYWYDDKAISVIKNTGILRSEYEYESL